MGCAETKETKETNEEDGFGEDVDYRNVPRFNTSYPEPYPPEHLRRQILDADTCAEVEDRVREIPGGTEAGYAPLLKYLAQDAGDQVEHVTAIYYWLVGQDYTGPPSTPDNASPSDKAGGDKAGGDTPRAYINMIREGSADLPTFFTILCRRSGIPCVILDGLSKDADYEAGSSERSTGRWNAVFAENDWRLVHVDWSVQARPDSNQNSTETQASDPDYYFMTDPAEFATFCQPENYAWQLLKAPYSKREFYNLPYLTPRFYQLGAEVVRPKKGTPKTSNGTIDAEIAFPKKVLNQLTLNYKLIFKEDISDDQYTGKGKRQHGVPTDLHKYVFMHRKSSRCMFDIRLPQAGVYIFSVHAKMMPQEDNDLDDDVMQKICELKLTSTNDSDDAEPLPECPDAGWGPTPVCRQMGLVPLSHFDGYIYIKSREVRTVRFRIQEEMDVKPVLSHDTMPPDELEKYVEGQIVGDEVTVRVRIPEEGQYSLAVYARRRGESEYRGACYYLLRQQLRLKHGELLGKRGRRKYRDQMLRKKLNHHLVNHTSPGELRDAMETFECYNVPDHGERKRTDEKLKQYWDIKYELDHAVKSRNIGNLNKWIPRAKASKYEPDLREDIERAEGFTEHMNKLKGNQHTIARMDEPTMLEVRSYKRPPPVVHHVMASTFVLLGEEKSDLKNWGYIQYQMGQSGKHTLKNRILARRPEDVSRETVDEAEELISPYSLQKCRDVSHGTATYYRWCQHFMHDVKQKHREDEEEEERRRCVDDGDEGDTRHGYDDDQARADSHTSRAHTPSDQDGARTHTPREERHPFMVDENAKKHNKLAKRPSQMPNRDSRDQQEPVSYAGFRE